MAVAQSGWGVRNPQVEKRPNPGGVVRDFEERQSRKTLSGQANDIRQPDPTPQYNPNLVYGQPARVEQYANGPWGKVQSNKRVNHKSKTEQAAYKAGKLWARARLSVVNGWVVGWAIFWYLTFQLPIAVISAAGIGMAYAVYAAAERILERVGFGGNTAFILDGINVIGSSKIVAAAGKIFLIDFNPIILFIIPFALVFLLGLFQLILTWFIYSLIGVRSLTGEHGGVKGVLFMLVGIGYAIPILNLFPLIFLWMAIVWKYPK